MWVYRSVFELPVLASGVLFQRPKRPRQETDMPWRRCWVGKRALDWTLLTFSSQEKHGRTICCWGWVGICNLCIGVIPTQKPPVICGTVYTFIWNFPRWSFRASQVWITLGNKYIVLYTCVYASRYCWCLKSCTTWDVWNPINNGINYQPQLVQDFSHQQYVHVMAPMILGSVTLGPVMQLCFRDGGSERKCLKIVSRCFFPGVMFGDGGSGDWFQVFFLQSLFFFETVSLLGA